MQTLVAMSWIYRIVALLLLAAPLSHAGQPAKLRVGIFDRPPFAMKDADARWTGLAVDVWERVSGELGLPYEYVETPLDRVIEETVAGRLDLTMGELGVSTDRARLVDFSQPYLAMPSAVALLKSSRGPHWLGFMRDVLTHGVGSILAVLLLTLLLFSVLLWLVERRVEHTHFGGHPWRGFGSALWFAAVTMTTVGYGDKTPQSTAGRAVAFLWMFFGVVSISVFTGAIASSIALSSLEGRITRTSDLAKYRVGVLDGSQAQRILGNSGVSSRTFTTAEEGLRALEAGQITAFVDNEASLRYLVNRDHPGTMLVEPLPTTHLTYAFAVRPAFPAEELRAIDIALIDQVMRPGWEQQVERWIGPPAR
ncbi:MAG: transporter substrate-binding domain-containing protein [Terrimicrobiaceae bacterium]|nr:transporter substrate-binding domain-containing protein [Terrimicrobiaceae bacterium]